MASGSRPRRAADDGRSDSTSTSAVRSRVSSASRSAGSRRSSSALRLPRRHTPRTRPVAPRVPARRLHRRDPGAVVGQQHRGHRAGDAPRQVDDVDAVEHAPRVGHALPPGSRPVDPVQLLRRAPPPPPPALRAPGGAGEARPHGEHGERPRRLRRVRLPAGLRRVRGPALGRPTRRRAAVGGRRRPAPPQPPAVGRRRSRARAPARRRAERPHLGHRGHGAAAPADRRRPPRPRPLRLAGGQGLLAGHQRRGGRPGHGRAGAAGAGGGGHVARRAHHVAPGRRPARPRARGPWWSTSRPASASGRRP